MVKARMGAHRSALLAVLGLLGAGLAFGQPRRETPGPSAGTAGSPDRGLVVVAVDVGSPAEKAGVKRGDILLRADKIELQNAEDLDFYVSRLKKGDALTLELSRSEVTRTVEVELGERSGRPYLGVSVEGKGARDGLGWSQGRGGLMSPMPGWGSATVEALVAEVMEGSPAATAGIVTGDAILSIDGTALQAGGSLATEIGKHKPGDEVSLEIRHADGTTATLSVKLGGSPEDAAKAYLGVRYQEGLSHPGLMGRGFRQMPFQWQPGETAPLRGGFVIREVAADSPAAQAGIKVGDVITAIDGQAVGAETVLATEIAKHKPGDALELTITDRSGANERTVGVTLSSRPDDKEKAYLGVVAAGRMWLVPNDTQPLPQGRMRLVPRSRGRSDV